MDTKDIAASLETLFAELADGANNPAGGAYMLNSGDRGLLRSLDLLSAADASRALDGGATIAAHAQHVRYGLSLMNRWAREGGDPFADAAWDAAWKTSAVDDEAWQAIRDGLGGEARAWRATLGSPRPVTREELNGLIGSIGHLAYHLGAIRQIAAAARGPREGTFTQGR
ncbi:MAG TPA: hypothetical protein VFO19_12285 [Vicinamibacterales bacterium]|nr:hypothetical protein [Vicinamibacterales bacterium]